MKFRLPLLMLVLLSLLTACNAQDSAPVAAAPAPAQGPVAGTDYLDIADGQPYAPLDGKVEVVEVFGYTCPHCAHFEPLIDSWKKQQPAAVRVALVPAAFGGYWVPYARAFYAADALGVLEQSHVPMFNALHVSHSLGPDSTPEQIGQFYAQFGADPKAFADTMQGPAVAAKLEQGSRFAARSKVDGTPSLVINGKYLVSADQRGYEHMFDTVDQLVARERAASH